MTWIETRVVARTDWADDLFTLRLDHKPTALSPGQFVNLGVTLEGERVKRSYSAASAPDAPLEVYVVVVAGGQLTPHLHALGVGDTLEMDDKPQGFFTLEHVPEARVLWMMATGTGLGPYMSMLRSGQLWSRFERVVVVHGARQLAQLGYRDELEQLSEARPVTYVPMVTREHDEMTIHGRITSNIERGILEKAAGERLDPETSHVLLCGNPAMIADTIEVLASRGMRKHRTRKPGHISTEKYW